MRDETVGQAIQITTTALLFVILARLLEPDVYGLVFLTVAIVHLIQMFAEWGLGSSTGRYVAEYRSKNPSQIPHIVRLGTCTWIVSISFAAIAIFFLADLIAEVAGQPPLSLFIQIGAVVFVGYAGVEFCRRVFQGFEQIRYAALIYMLEGIFRLIFVCWFVLAGFGGVGALWGFAAGSMLATVIGFVILYIRLYRPQVTSGLAAREEGLYRRLVEYALPLTLSHGSSQIDKQVDTLLVGILLTPVAVAYYSLAKQIVTPIIRPATIFGFTMAPKVGTEFANGNVDQARQTYQTVIETTFIIFIPAMVGLLIVAEPAVELVFGNEYLGAVPILKVLTIFVLLEALSQAIGQALDYLGKAKFRAYIKGITALANVALTAWFVTVIGVAGAAWATVITHTVYVLFSLWILHRVLDLNTRQIGISVVKAAGIAILMGVIVFTIIILSESVLMVLPAIGIGLSIWVASVHYSGLFDLQQFSTKI